MIIHCRAASLLDGLHQRVGNGKESPVYVVNDSGQSLDLPDTIRGEVLVIKRASASQTEINVAVVPEEKPSERIVGVIVMKRPRVVSGSVLYRADDGDFSIVIAEPGVVLIGDGDYGPHAVILERDGWETVYRSTPIASDEVIRI